MSHFIHEGSFLQRFKMQQKRLDKQSTFSHCFVLIHGFNQTSLKGFLKMAASVMDEGMDIGLYNLEIREAFFFI